MIYYIKNSNSDGKSTCVTRNLAVTFESVKINRLRYIKHGHILTKTDCLLRHRFIFKVFKIRFLDITKFITIQLQVLTESENNYKIGHSQVRTHLRGQYDSYFVYNKNIINKI